MTQHQDVGAPYGIKGFPTLKFFAYNKNKPIDYNGARSSDAMGDEAFKQLRKLTKDKVLVMPVLLLKTLQNLSPKLDILSYLTKFKSWIPLPDFL